MSQAFPSRLAFIVLWLLACGDDATPATPDANSGAPDANTGTPDANTGAPDANAGALDAGGDAEPDDGAAPDAVVDAQVDAGAVDAQVDADADAVTDAGALVFPETLAESGLYAAGSTSELAPGVLAYTPAYALWSDGADKQRWLLLPEGTQIDTSDMDDWRFPVGTKAWKEFQKDGKRLETRLFWKTAQGWFRLAFAWNEDETAATAVPDGAADVRGTTHDVPGRDDCGACHDSRPDRLLGVSAIQLSGARAGLTLNDLIAGGWLSDPPAADFALPDTTEWNALGYLHANCGNCHNPQGEAYDRLDLDLWLRTAQLGAAADTESYKTTVDADLTDTGGGLTKRIAPGSAEQSGLLFRMEMRGSEEAMPPIASELPDEAGLGLLEVWIDAL